jgi:signal transduction histidine kinase
MTAAVMNVLEPDGLGALSHEDLGRLAQTEWGPVIIRDQHRRLLWAPEGYKDRCGAFSARRGMDCSNCHLRKPVEGTCRILCCAHGQEKAESQICLSGALAGYVSAGERQRGKLGKKSLPKRAKRQTKILRSGVPLEPWLWWPVLAQVAHTIQIEVEISRAERLRLAAEKKFRNIGSSGEAVETVFDALRDLFGECDIIFYRRQDTGVLRRHRVRGKHQALMPGEISDRAGHVGWVVENGEPYYVPDLSREPAKGPRFHQPSLEVPYHSAISFPVFVPTPPMNTMSLGVIQICGFKTFMFPFHLHAVCQSIISSGNLHAARLQFKAPAENLVVGREPLQRWRRELVSILEEALEDRGKALTFKRRLREVVVEIALAISGARNASLRWASSDGNHLRFVASTGEGWIDAVKELIYSKDDGSTGIYVLNTGQAAYIPDTQHPNLPYREIFSGTNCLAVFPIRERGKTVAVLSVDGATAHAFSDEIREALMVLVSEFEASNDAIVVIEHGLIRSLEQTLVVSGLRQFAFEASRVIGRLFETGACSIITRGTEASGGDLVLQGTTSEIRGAGELEFVDDIGIELARKVMAEGGPHRTELHGHPCLAAPISMRGGVRAVISLIGRQQDGPHQPKKLFSAEDETLLAQIGSWMQEMLESYFLTTAADAIARKGKEESHHAQRLLLAVGLESLGHALAQLVLIQTNAVSVHFRLVQQDGSLRLAGSAGMYSGFLQESRTNDAGISAQAIRNQEEMWACDVPSDDRWKSPLAELRNRLELTGSLWIQSSCCIFLRSPDSGTIFGTLVVDWREKQALDSEQKQGLASLAANSARLFEKSLRERENAERLSRQVRIMADLSGIAEEYATNGNLPGLLASILKTATDKTGMHGSIRLKNEETGKWILHAPEYPESGLLPIVGESELLHPGTVASGPLPVGDLSTYEPYLAFLARCPDKSQKDFLRAQRAMVQVPIRHNGRVVGLMTLYKREPQKFADETLSLLTILASFAAVGIGFDEIKNQLDQVIPLAETTEIVADFLHVVRNHAAGINFLLGTIRNQDLVSEAAVDRFERLRKRVTSLVNSYESIRTASSMGDRLWVELHVSVNAVLHDFEDAFPNVKRQLEIKGDQLLMYGPRTEIESVVRHLLTNALEALANTGGEVTISLDGQSDGAKVFIEVRDNGPGMSQEVLNRCRHPFFTTKSGMRASGLGLWISSQILKRMGAEMDIRSQVGVGTTVRIVLPRSEPQ